MIKVFKTTNEYDNYVEGGMVAGDLYYVIEDKSVHFRTNNINGEDNEYDMSEGGGGTIPTGNIEITQNGTNIDVAQYATATVNVSAPTPTYSELTFINGECENHTISCQDGDCFEIYNPNGGHLWIGIYSSTETNSPVGYEGDNEHFYITCNCMKGFGNGGINNPNQIIVDINPASADAYSFNGIVYYRKLN